MRALRRRLQAPFRPVFRVLPVPPSGMTVADMAHVRADLDGTRPCSGPALNCGWTGPCARYTAHLRSTR